LACLPGLALPAVIAAPAPSERPRFDWPQWRGPDRRLLPTAPTEPPAVPPA